MAVVHFPRTLLPHTGGLEQITLDAPRVKELQAALVARFPGLEAEIDQLAVAIDGEVRPDAAYEPLLPLTEVYLVPKIAGGEPDARRLVKWELGNVELENAVTSISLI